MMLGGDKVFASDIEAYRRVFEPSCVFRNGYGTSEVKLISEYLADHTSHIPENDTPVGFVVQETEVLIMDDNGNEVGPGQEGEIVVRSRFVSPGYWRRPEVTATKFAIYATDISKRLYSNCDLGRMEEDGCLFHLGRKDFQVKIRGQRVEIEEIENTLLKIAGIQEAAVMLRQVGIGDEQLVAYLATEGNAPTNNEIRNSLAEKLPAYMVPGQFVRLTQLPHNSNGKIDRVALPMPDQERPELENEYEMPAAGLETTIATIWGQFLGIEQVGAGDDFFELGGHSMLAVQMLTALEKALGRKVPVASLVQGQTVRGMAAWINGEEIADRPRMLIPIQEGGNQLPICLVPAMAASPLSFVELARELGPEHPIYAIDDTILLESEGTLEEVAAQYLAELRMVHPTGPYVIGGRCIGAIAALEMTRQLEEQGEEVALLVILDGVRPDLARPKGIPAKFNYYLQRLQKHLAAGSALTIIRTHLQWRLKNFKTSLQKPAGGGGRTAKYFRYKPQTLQAPMVVYESEEFYRLLHHERWQVWAGGGMKCLMIPGTMHKSMWNTEGSMVQIATDLKKHLEQALVKSPVKSPVKSDVKSDA
jgi:thioesterase domain-containing protein